MPIKKPESDFDRWQDREKDMNESHRKGKEIYLKGESKNGKKKGK